MPTDSYSLNLATHATRIWFGTLNHRRFGRSEHPERVGKSPAELLTGTSHPHWVELLGYQRFERN